MKFIITGDWHLRATAPQNRKDSDYFVTLKDKGDFIFDYAIQNNIEFMLHGSDIFDSSIVPDRIKTWLARRLRNIKCLTVIGNHDYSMRQLIDNSSIAVMIESQCLTRTDFNPFVIGNDIHIYGASYNEDIPKIKDKSKYNILVIHKMISDRDMWQGNVSYVDSKMFLTKHKFDLVVSSDNHASFVTKLGNRLLINPGSLCRARIDQIDHKPCFFVIDTDTQEYEQIFIPVKPAEEVFNLNIKEKKENQELTKLMEELKIRKNHEFNYLKNAEEVALEKDNDVDDWAKTVMMEVINEVNEKGLK